MKFKDIFSAWTQKFPFWKTESNFSSGSWSWESPKTTVVVLLAFTFLLSLGGYFYLRTVEVPPSAPPMSPRSEESTRYLNQGLVYAQLDVDNLSAATAGINDDLYVVRGNEIIFYQIYDQENGGIALRRDWNLKFEESPTAIYFIHQAASPLAGNILIAFPNRLELLSPIPSNLQSVSLTSFDSDAEIADITADDQFIYAADRGKKVIYQIDFFGKIQREIGLPDENSGFTGFQFDSSPFFAIDAAPQKEVLYAANPSKFRIEAFSTETGDWLPNLSWENASDPENKFTGKENPSALMVLADSSFLTAESGRTPLVKYFNPQGNFITTINDPKISTPLTENQTLFLAVGFSKKERNRLLILSPTGKLAGFTI